MRIGVIGASGFLGSNLIRHLRMNSSYEVTAFSRTEHEVYAGTGTKWVRTDLSEVSEVKALIDPLDVVYYLAHQGAPNSPLGWIDEVETNLRPLMTFLEAVKGRGRPLKVIYTSSGGAIYGRSASHRPWLESDPIRPLSAYGVTKLSAEQFLRIASLSGNLQISSLRISNPYGNHFPHRKNQGLIDVAVRNLLEGKVLNVFVPMENVRDYIHMDDLTGAMEKCMELTGAFDVLNLGSGTGISIRGIVDRIEGATGRKLQINHAPAAASGTDIDWSVLNIDHARKSLRWEPRYDLDSGLGEYLKRKFPAQI